MKKVYALLFDGYADWELGNVLAELRRLGNLDVVTAGILNTQVVSMGGLNVTVDKALSEIDIDDVMIFILPGGYLWEESYPVDLIGTLLNRLAEADIPIAAICAATTVLAKVGLLKGKKHTSNSLRYLKTIVPEYSDESEYVDSLCVRDQHIITASGLGSVDFAMEVFNELDLASKEMRDFWYDAFKHGKHPDDLEHSEIND